MWSSLQTQWYSWNFERREYRLDLVHGSMPMCQTRIFAHFRSGRTSVAIHIWNQQTSQTWLWKIGNWSEWNMAITRKVATSRLMWQISFVVGGCGAFWVKTRVENHPFIGPKSGLQEDPERQVVHLRLFQEFTWQRVLVECAKCSQHDMAREAPPCELTQGRACRIVSRGRLRSLSENWSSSCVHLFVHRVLCRRVLSGVLIHVTIGECLHTNDMAWELLVLCSLVRGVLICVAYFAKVCVSVAGSPWESAYTTSLCDTHTQPFRLYEIHILLVWQTCAHVSGQRSL